MIKTLKKAAASLLILTSGCSAEKTAADTAEEEYGKVISVEKDCAVLSIENSDGVSQTIVLDNDERVAILKDSALVKASLLDPNDMIIVTYKDGSLQVVQVIS